MIQQNDGQNDSDIVKDAQQTFHDLRGRLTVIMSAADRVREDPVTPMQEAALQQIETTIESLANAITQMSKVLAETLKLTPAARLIWQTKCLNAHQIDQAALKTTLAEIRDYYPLHEFTHLIIVAPPRLLPSLRTSFAALGCNHIRIGTMPADVPYLLDAASAELIAMAPPMGEEETWWRTLRPLMQGYRYQPILISMKEAAQP